MKEKEKNTLNEEREITLAPREELLVRAKEIAEATPESEKFLFTLHYDTDNAGFVKKALNELGVTPEEETEDSVTAHMNMEQLEFMKSIDCIEKVTAEERDKKRKLRDFRNKKPSKKKAKKKAKKKTAPAVEASGNTADTPAVMSATAETQAVATLSGCCCCPTNTTMEKAQEIKTESLIDGCICCPSMTQWFKFTAPESRKYTISTVGSLDTVGVLYNASGEELDHNDDFAGKTNFRIIRNLVKGSTYYITVRANNSETGNYMLKVTKNVLAKRVVLNKHTIVLKPNTRYELPLTSNYVYTGYKGAERISGFSASLDPADTNEQKIWWSEFGDMLDIEVNWDDNNNRYIHLITKGTGIGTLYAIDWLENGKRNSCKVYVGGSPVTGVTLNVNRKIMKCSDDDFTINANVLPRDVLNKEVEWSSSNKDVAIVRQSGRVTVYDEGTAIITATTKEGGFTASCRVTAYDGPYVIIKKDNGYSDENRTSFSLEFDDGKIWKSIGCDLSLDENRSGVPLDTTDLDSIAEMTIPEQRYIANYRVDYSAKQLAFAYFCDPLGVEFYLRYYNTVTHKKTLAQILRLKDEVYKELFGRWPRLIKIFPDKSVSYFKYSTSMPDARREDFLSDAESLFGDHTVVDLLTFAELAIAEFKLVVVTALSLAFEPLDVFFTSTDLLKWLFFNGAVEDVISSGSSDVLEEYVNSIIKLGTSNEVVQEELSKRLGAIFKVVEVLTTAVNTGLFIPTTDGLKDKLKEELDEELQDVQKVCNKIKSLGIPTIFMVDGEELDLDSIINASGTD